MHRWMTTGVIVFNISTGLALQHVAVMLQFFIMVVRQLCIFRGVRQISIVLFQLLHIFGLSD